MPGLQSDCSAITTISPTKKSRLSLKFFHKKETKRALDFSETQVEDQKTTEPEGPERQNINCDQVVPLPHPSSTLTCERKESLVPFVGLNNLGNTCYLNSILQVLYYCPGFKDGIKMLYNLLSNMKEEKLKNNAEKNDELEGAEQTLPVNMELLGSFHSLIVSLEQLQSSFLLNPEKHSDGELATPPRRLLNILRQLNPMYEGYLQHDAQEVLQCILGYIQEACETIKKEHKSDVEPAEQPPDLQAERATREEEPETAASEASSGNGENSLKDPEQEDNLEGQVNGKRKSDTEAGNAKKKSKPLKIKKSSESKHFTRSKRKSSRDISEEIPKEETNEESDLEGKNDGSKGPSKRKKSSRLSWFKPSRKQPSIFSKFRSMGRISSHTGVKGEASHEGESGDSLSCKTEEDAAGCATPARLLPKTLKKTGKAKNEGTHRFDLMERMFQGQLVLRTRCLECECYTERREDFQDISVPVQEDEPRLLECSSEISPDPKLELKTLKWAISQFASVERIVGQDKYFCETCHHYAEAERSLLFDKTPEVVTIHLKCFAANSSDIDPYASLSKVNTPLQTPLKLSLEEWGTRPSKEHYQLFAVVMHSGVTISSGHYTAFIKMVDLKEVQLQAQLTEDIKEEPQPYGPLQDYDDGEVSFSIGPKPNAAGKASGKKGSDGVGLLGGQRSISSFELGANKQANPDKAASAAADCVKTERTGGAGYDGVLKKEVDTSEERSAASGGTTSDRALGSLLDYEGKWMLFDDSEVTQFDEKDFLTACSPETCTTSTPYLLFYKKVCQG